jgi:tetratricopeptide (TPR) repeat protein
MSSKQKYAWLKSRLLLLFIVCFANANAQQDKQHFLTVVKAHRGDTAEVNALNGLFKILKNTDPKLAKMYLDRALKLARKIDYTEGQAMSYRLYGGIYTTQGNFTKAEEMLSKAKTRFEQSKDDLGLISCLNGLGNVKVSQGLYTEALQAYIQTAELNEALDNQSGLAKAYHNIGTVHLALSQYDEALEYFNKSIRIKRKLGDEVGMVATINASAATHSEMGNYKKALKALFKAYQMADHAHADLERGNILNNIGAQFFNLNQLDSAAHYYDKCLESYRAMDQKPEIVLALNNIGGLYLKRKDGPTAKAYYDSSLVMAESLGTRASMITIYEGLAEASALMGDYKSAYEWYMKFHALNDSLVGSDVRESINALQTKFDSGRKDLRIAQLEIREAEASTAAANWKILILVLIFTVAILLTWLMYYFNRRKIREKLRIKELEQKALRAQMNPHFIFNSLNSIQRMYIEGREEAANDYMADFSHLLRSILENSGRSAITLSEEWQITKLYLELEQLRTDNLFTYSIELDSSINPLETKIPPLILQPYVENAIWHGIMPKNAMGHIEIRMQLHAHGKLRCEITDDGVGYGYSRKSEGFRKSDSKGMEITAERLGGGSHVSIESEEGKGTKITLIIDKTV